ncbi:hypothetical protein SESBI_09074 [Sesbania bispinosa]|nr:hypothetical protein SESBI_09074 [Sesbania bispinosa]
MAIVAGRRHMGALGGLSIEGDNERWLTVVEGETELRPAAEKMKAVVVMVKKGLWGWMRRFASHFLCVVDSTGNSVFWLL